MDRKAIFPPILLMTFIVLGVGLLPPTAGYAVSPGPGATIQDDVSAFTVAGRTKIQQTAARDHLQVIVNSTYAYFPTAHAWHAWLHAHYSSPTAVTIGLNARKRTIFAFPGPQTGLTQAQADAGLRDTTPVFNRDLAQGVIALIDRYHALGAVSPNVTTTGGSVTGGSAHSGGGGLFWLVLLLILGVLFYAYRRARRSGASFLNRGNRGGGPSGGNGFGGPSAGGSTMNNQYGGQYTGGPMGGGMGGSFVGGAAGGVVGGIAGAAIGNELFNDHDQGTPQSDPNAGGPLDTAAGAGSWGVDTGDTSGQGGTGDAGGWSADSGSSDGGWSGDSGSSDGGGW